MYVYVDLAGSDVGIYLVIFKSVPGVAISVATITKSVTIIFFEVILVADLSYVLEISADIGVCQARLLGLDLFLWTLVDIFSPITLNLYLTHKNVIFRDNADALLTFGLVKLDGDIVLRYTFLFRVHFLKKRLSYF